MPQCYLSTQGAFNLKTEVLKVDAQLGIRMDSGVQAQVHLTESRTLIKKLRGPLASAVLAALTGILTRAFILNDILSPKSLNGKEPSSPVLPQQAGRIPEVCQEQYPVSGGQSPK